MATKELTFAESSGAILQYGGIVLAAKKAAKKISENRVQVLSADVSSTSATTFYVNSTKGLPSTPFTAGIGTETDLTITAVSPSANSITVTRGASPTTHNKGDLMIVYTANSYSSTELKPIGFLEKIVFSPGVKGGSILKDCVGRQCGVNRPTAEPTLKLTHMQSGYNELALMMGVNLESVEVDGFTQLSSEVVTDYAIFILTMQTPQDSSGIVYGYMKFPHASLMESSDLTMDENVNYPETTWGILYDSLDGANKFISKGA